MKERHLIKAVIGEVLIIGATMTLGIIEAWGPFAAFALTCILFPMWMIVVLLLLNSNLEGNGLTTRTGGDND